MGKLEDIKKYRELDAVNQSLLKSLIKGNFGKFKGGDHLSIGSLVDCMLTTPELYNDLFHVIDFSVGDKPKKIINRVYNTIGAEKTFEEIVNEHQSFIFDLMNEFEYKLNTYSDPQDKRRFASLIKDCQDFYSELTIAGDKTIVDSEMINLAERIVDSIKNGRFTSCFHFLPHGVVEKTQVVITWTYRDILCKGLLDKMIINTNDYPVMLGLYEMPAKSILPIDYKTTGYATHHFEKEMIKYGYSIQGSFYRFGLTQVIEIKQPDYEVLDFMFIVESSAYPGKPLAYQLSHRDERIARYGGINVSNEIVPAVWNADSYNSLLENVNLEVLGWEQGLTLWQWHQKNAEWEYSKSIVEQNGIINTQLY